MGLYGCKSLLLSINLDWLLNWILARNDLSTNFMSIFVYSAIVSILYGFLLADQRVKKLLRPETLLGRGDLAEGAPLGHVGSLGQNGLWGGIWVTEHL